MKEAERMNEETVYSRLNIIDRNKQNQLHIKQQVSETLIRDTDKFQGIIMCSLIRALIANTYVPLSKADK